MRLELIFSNEPRVLSSVNAFLIETLKQTSLETIAAEKLTQFALNAVRDAVEHAYPEREEGSIKLTITEASGKLELLVRDFGMPQDIDALERGIATSGGRQSFSHPGSDVADEVHWLSYGSEGNGLQIIKWLHSTRVTEIPARGTSASCAAEVPLAPQQQYDIRRMRANEAVQVSQLMYRAYGNTYFNQDVYYPERVAAQNEHDAVVSYVAVGENGGIAGHYALEFNQEGPVAEGGQAVVDPAHRGRGLLDRMKDAALIDPSCKDLVGWYADAVTVHMLTQKSNVSHDGRLTSVDLGIAPRKESFRNVAEEQSQRVTCLLYFHWLQGAVKRTIYAPSRHQAIVAEIYEQLGCPVTFGQASLPSGHGILSVQNDVGGAKAFLRVTEVGEDSVRRIVHAKQELVERSHAEAVYVELPLANPATGYIADELEQAGFGFAGVLPHFSSLGDLLRMVYLVDPLLREPIITFDPFAARLVDYVLAEQSRVRNDF
jgi:anti-sigma regulatory factor (Ser/Thr protein kinase)